MTKAETHFSLCVDRLSVGSFVCVCVCLPLTLWCKPQHPLAVILLRAYWISCRTTDGRHSLSSARRSRRTTLRRHFYIIVIIIIIPSTSVAAAAAAAAGVGDDKLRKSWLLMTVGNRTASSAMLWDGADSDCDFTWFEALQRVKVSSIWCIRMFSLSLRSRFTFCGVAPSCWRIKQLITN